MHSIKWSQGPLPMQETGEHERQRENFSKSRKKRTQQPLHKIYTINITIPFNAQINTHDTQQTSIIRELVHQRVIKIQRIL